MCQDKSVVNDGVAGPDGWRAAGVRFESDRGAYDARRAAALSGVPSSTLHYWAREGIYEPSIAPGPRDRLWSWNDLLVLRLIDWLRQPKGPGGPERTDTREIKRALVELRNLGQDQIEFYWAVKLGLDGKLFLTTSGRTVRGIPGRQAAWADALNLVEPYRAAPDLLQPRPLLQIIPGKLHGEPHIVDTRIPSAALYGFHTQGYSVDEIRSMFPEAMPKAIAEAISFEESLIRRRAA
ncbi:MAG: DUF433 domain-containing protein [Chloroflexota bacterium]|nr:MAG: DUF433 domain-containing protein [Chloroflexota bacterium]